MSLPMPAFWKGEPITTDEAAQAQAACHILARRGRLPEHLVSWAERIVARLDTLLELRRRPSRPVPGHGPP